MTVMGPAPQPRVPFAPLLRTLEAAGLDTNKAIANHAEVSENTVRKARRDGTLTIWAADRIACGALNINLAEIYGDDWLDHDWMRAGRLEAALEQLQAEMAR